MENYVWCVGSAHHLRHLEKQQIIYTKGMKNSVLLAPSSPCDLGFFLSPPVGNLRPKAAVLTTELNLTIQQGGYIVKTVNPFFKEKGQGKAYQDSRNTMSS